MTQIVRQGPPRQPNHVDHRDGAGHLYPAYRYRAWLRALRARVHDGTPRVEERAFVRGPTSAHLSAEQSGEEFVLAATTGEERGAYGLDDVSIEERGGPFIVTTGGREFAYDIDESNPTGSTREPFPTT